MIGYTGPRPEVVRFRSRLECHIEDVSVQLRRWTFVAAAVALAGIGVMPVGNALADDDGKRKRRDHEVARDALTNGEIRPLEAIIAEVRRTVPGDIVGIELEKYSGQWVYKIKVIAPSGAMQRVTIDARGGAVAPSSAGQPAALAPLSIPGPIAPATTLPPAAETRSR